MVTILLSTFLMTACQKQVGSASKNLHSLSSKPVYNKPRLNGQKSFKLNDQLYLGSSENLGLFLFDDSGKVITSTQGNYEGLDVRVLNGLTYVISINKELARAELFSLEDQSFSFQQSIKLEQAGINNVCFYQPNNNELQAILLTETSKIEQRLLLDDEGNNADFLLLRSMPSPPNFSACVADDQHGELYIAEEVIGIWQYPLDLESELERQVVALTEPYGALTGEIKDLSILSDGRLLISLPDMAKLLVLQRTNDTWQSSWLSLDKNSTPESATSYLSRNIIWFDKETDSYIEENIDLPNYDSNYQSVVIAEVMAKRQTAPVSHFGDAADDPAIWPNYQSPQNSKILATDKTAGLYVYGLDGSSEQFIASGRVNNVDISFGFNWQGKQVDLAAASNRTLNSISLYAINSAGKVSEIGNVPTTLNDVYGLCSYKSKVDEQHYVFINDENGQFQQYRITQNEGKLAGALVREFKVDSQPEGCVVDEITATLYFGEEAEGVWRTSAEPKGSELELVVTIDKQTLFDDVEGLSIYQGKSASYLVVSSQGNNSYVLYNLEDMSFVGNFRVKANYQLGIDGTSETDGLAVSNFNFGQEYSSGMLVVQDGRNVMPNKPQNFKLISWQDVAESLSLHQ